MVYVYLDTHAHHKLNSLRMYTGHANKLYISSLPLCVHMHLGCIGWMRLYLLVHVVPFVL